MCSANALVMACILMVANVSLAAVPKAVRRTPPPAAIPLFPDPLTLRYPEPPLHPSSRPPWIYVPQPTMAVPAGCSGYLGAVVWPNAWRHHAVRIGLWEGASIEHDRCIMTPTICLFGCD